MAAEKQHSIRAAIHSRALNVRRGRFDIRAIVVL